MLKGFKRAPRRRNTDLRNPARRACVTCAYFGWNKEESQPDRFEGAGKPYFAWLCTCGMLNKDKICRAECPFWQGGKDD